MEGRDKAGRYEDIKVGCIERAERKRLDRRNSIVAISWAV